MSAAPSMSSALAELICCSVCTESYTDTDDGKHPPYLLPCGHTYCLHCLHRIRQPRDGHISITCPEDRSLHHFETVASIATTLKRNFTMIALIAQQRTVQQQQRQQQEKQK